MREHDMCKLHNPKEVHCHRFFTIRRSVVLVTGCKQNSLSITGGLHNSLTMPAPLHKGLDLGENTEVGATREYMSDHPFNSNFPEETLYLVISSNMVEGCPLGSWGEGRGRDNLRVHAWDHPVNSKFPEETLFLAISSNMIESCSLVKMKDLPFPAVPCRVWMFSRSVCYLRKFFRGEGVHDPQIP